MTVTQREKKSPMTKLWPDAHAALDGIVRDGMLLAIGGFGLCGIPEALIVALRDSGFATLPSPVTMRVLTITGWAAAPNAANQENDFQLCGRERRV